MSIVSNNIVEGDCDDDIGTDNSDNHVKLNEINQNSYENSPNRYVLVKVVWRSDKPPPESTHKPCRFILSDDTGHIAAILFLSGNIHTTNVYNKLKPGNKILKLKNFHVQEEKESYRFIKHQPKQMTLSQSTRDLKEMSISAISESFLNCLPIQYTSLENVDDKPNQSFVDVIGHAKYISYILTSTKNENLQYQKVIMSTHSSFSPEAEDDQFLRYLTLFDGHIGKIKVGMTYILQNVKVDYFKVDNSNSIKTTALTIAHEINDVEGMYTLLPPDYLPLTQIENLFSSESSSREQLLAISTTSNTIARPQKRPLSPYLSQPPAFRKQQKLELLGSLQHTPDSGANIEDVYEDFPEHVSYDFINSKTPLVVKVLKAKVLKGTTNKAYSMRSNSRGIALILNNYFPEEEDKARTGSHFDASYLEQFLRFCKFDVFIKNDITSEELPTILTDFKSKDSDEIDCCFVALFSHGLLGGIEMVDGEYVNLHSEIIYQFDDTNFPQFKDKPKVFVIQACQNLPTLESLPSKWTSFRNQGQFSIDNAIVCHATIPEVSAERDIYLGSPFIYVLVHTLMNHAHDRHFKDIYYEVRNRLRGIKRSNSDPLNCSYMDFGFKKFLYFNPGL